MDGVKVLLAWGAKVSPKFASRLLGMCHVFGWGDDHASWLMSCMAFESDETFSPSVRNAAGSGAVGLIQFMPKTAMGLGTSIDALSRMSAEGQLDYVEKYFRPYASRIRSLSDMYMAILLPKYVGSPGSAVLFSGGIACRQNAGLDANHDGSVSKDEATAFLAAKYRKGLLPTNAALVS